MEKHTATKTYCTKVSKPGRLILRCGAPRFANGALRNRPVMAMYTDLKYSNCEPDALRIRV